MIGAADFGLLAPNHLRILQAAAAEPPARDRGARAACAGLGKREIDQPILFERGAQRQIEETALPARINLRHSGERFGKPPVCGHDTQASRALGNKHPLVGQDLEAPGMFQPFGNRLDIKDSGYRRRRRRPRRLRLQGRRSASHRANDQRKPYSQTGERRKTAGSQARAVIAGGRIGRIVL